jgi:hypothetical protein
MRSKCDASSSRFMHAVHVSTFRSKYLNRATPRDVTVLHHPTIILQVSYGIVSVLLLSGAMYCLCAWNPLYSGRALYLCATIVSHFCSSSSSSSSITTTTTTATTIALMIMLLCSSCSILSLTSRYVMPVGMWYCVRCLNVTEAVSHLTVSAGFLHVACVVAYLAAGHITEGRSTARHKEGCTGGAGGYTRMCSADVNVHACNGTALSGVFVSAFRSNLK